MDTIKSLSEEFRNSIEQEQAQIGDYCILLVSTRRGYSTNQHAYKSVEDFEKYAQVHSDAIDGMEDIGFEIIFFEK